MKTNAAESIAIYAEDAVRKRMRKRWERRRAETSAPPRLFLGSLPRTPEAIESLDHFSADWRKRWPNVDGWTPFSVRELRVRP